MQQIQQQVKDQTDAIAVLEKAAQKLPGSGVLRWRLAMAYHVRAALREDNRNDYKIAISHYVAAIKLNSGLDVPAVQEKIAACENYSR